MGRQAVFMGANAVLCALLWASSASAGIPGETVSLGTSKGLDYWKATYTAAASQVTQPVTCEGDSEATGGGGAVEGPPATSMLNESFTQPGPSGWTVEGTPGTTGDVTGYAICAGIDLDVVVGQDLEVPSGSSDSFATFCIDDDSVTGGGVEASNTGMAIGASYPPELQTDNWFGQAKNLAVDERVMYVHAVCTDAYDLRYRNSEVVNVQPGQTKTASAMCKSKHAVVGGGFVGYFDGLPAAGGWTTTNRPRDSKKDRKKVPDDGWTATYHNDAVVTHRLLVRAVCKAGNAPL